MSHVSDAKAFALACAAFLGCSALLGYFALAGPLRPAIHYPTHLALGISAPSPAPESPCQAAGIASPGGEQRQQPAIPEPRPVFDGENAFPEGYFQRAYLNPVSDEAPAPIPIEWVPVEPAGTGSRNGSLWVYSDDEGTGISDEKIALSPRAGPPEAQPSQGKDSRRDASGNPDALARSLLGLFGVAGIRPLMQRLQPGVSVG